MDLRSVEISVAESQAGAQQISSSVAQGAATSGTKVASAASSAFKSFKHALTAGGAALVGGATQKESSASQQSAGQTATVAGGNAGNTAFPTAAVAHGGGPLSSPQHLGAGSQILQAAAASAHTPVAQHATVASQHATPAQTIGASSGATIPALLPPQDQGSKRESRARKDGGSALRTKVSRKGNKGGGEDAIAGPLHGQGKEGSIRKNRGSGILAVTSSAAASLAASKSEGATTRGSSTTAGLAASLTANPSVIVKNVGGANTGVGANTGLSKAEKREKILQEIMTMEKGRSSLLLNANRVTSPEASHAASHAAKLANMNHEQLQIYYNYKASLFSNAQSAAASSAVGGAAAGASTTSTAANLAAGSGHSSSTGGAGDASQQLPRAGSKTNATPKHAGGEARDVKVYGAGASASSTAGPPPTAQTATGGHDGVNPSAAGLTPSNQRLIDELKRLQNSLEDERESRKKAEQKAQRAQSAAEQLHDKLRQVKQRSSIARAGDRTGESPPSSPATTSAIAARSEDGSNVGTLGHWVDLITRA